VKARFLLLFLVSGIIPGTMGQNTIDLTFTAVDSSAYVRLDSIKVMNRTQGSETMICWPDTTLSLEINQGDLLLCVGFATLNPVGISDVSTEISSFEVHQNYPNPMEDRSDIPMYIPQKAKVQLTITDFQGRVVLRTDYQLDAGHHSFRFHPGGGSLYFLTSQWNGISRSIKMISTGRKEDKSCTLEYIGSNNGKAFLKASSEVIDFTVRQSGILDTPEEDTIYTFQFATNIPCPGTPTVEYEGQVYNTIQIFSQCWLKENLNVGLMINGNQNQTNNSIIEKYCYNNNPDSCTKYGGLYQWNEIMQYTTKEGVQGICPPGWHLPMDEEWKVLEGAVDSQYGIGNKIWDNDAFRGHDAGTNLKTTSGWNNNGNGTDLYGFSGLPCGHHYLGGAFYDIGNYAYWWTSTGDVNNFAYGRHLDYTRQEVYRFNLRYYGFPVRCLRDN